jgi:hypothetical protein
MTVGLDIRGLAVGCVWRREPSGLRYRVTAVSEGGKVKLSCLDLPVVVNLRSEALQRSWTLEDEQ